MDYQYLYATIVAVVEGLTEFLPVSSTGHMIIVGNMLGFEGPVVDVFEVFIQFGAILSVLFIYGDRFWHFFTPDGWRLNHGFSAWHVGVGCVPCMVLAFFCYKHIKNLLFNPFTVAVGLVLGALLLFWAEHQATKHQLVVKDLDQMSLKQALYVGLFQILSLWPGFSRSGSTIAGGMLVGLSREVSASFTFIMAVPIMFAASLYDLYKHYKVLNSDDFAILALGFVVAGIVAYLSVKWFVRFVGRHNLSGFAWYRIALAVFTVWYFYR